MKISFNAGCVIGDQLFYSDNFCNSLLCADLNTRTLNYLGEFPSEKRAKVDLHKQCLRYRNKIVFLPNMADNIHIYDIETADFLTVPIIRSSDTRFLFCGGFIDGDVIYCFPGNLEQRIVKYNILRNEYEELDNFYAFIGGVKGIRAQCFWKMCYKDGRAYLVILGSSQIVSYDTESKKTTVIDTQIDKLDSIYYIEEVFYLCTYDMKLYRWNPNNNTTYLISQEGKMKPSGAGIIVGNRNAGLYAVPNYGGEILIYKSDRGFIHEESLAIHSQNIDVRCVHFENFDYWQSDKIVLFPSMSGNLEIIFADKVCDLQLSEISDGVYKNKYFEAMGIDNTTDCFVEGMPYALDDYLEAIKLL